MRGSRDRRPIITSASGNSPLPIPTSTIHSQAPRTGATNSPTKAMTKETSMTTIAGRCHRCGSAADTRYTGIVTAL